jgi:hypothetical protein
MKYEKQLTSMLVPFYLGEKPDAAGRMIQEIWAWDFEQLECAHDYIQWLFPLSEKSTFNLNAPVVDEEIIQQFQGDPRLQQNLLHSLTVMLRFYGLQCNRSKEGTIVVDKSEDYPIRKPEWVSRFDHNYLRITRILKCLMIVGLNHEARAFYTCLRQIYREDKDQIGSKTFQYWKNSILDGDKNE